MNAGKQYYPPMSDLPPQEDTFAQFITAIKTNSFEAVEDILRSADPAIVNQIETQFRQPALYFAALVQGDDESSELIKLLIRNGANVKHKDFNEQTILFYICREGKEKCAQLLLSHGLSLDDLDIYGQTPMFYAVSENRLEIVKKYATKERVNHVDKLAKQSPIYYAARRGHLEMCRLLIEKGAELTHLDMSNKTVLEYAKKAKYTELAQYLASQLKKVKQLNKNSEQADKKSRKSKDDFSRDSRQTYKIVFCNQKGEIKDATEEEIKAILAERTELAAYLDNPDSIPAEVLTQAEGESWEKAASRVLQLCTKAKGAYLFLEPVDPVKFNIMDYFDIITRPMDLGTVKNKLTHNCYQTPAEFVEDMNLIWQNSYRYNGESHVVSNWARELENAFKDLVKTQGLDKYLSPAE